jgi:hypothetical protein
MPRCRRSRPTRSKARRISTKRAAAGCRSWARARIRTRRGADAVAHPRPRALLAAEGEPEARQRRGDRHRRLAERQGLRQAVAPAERGVRHGLRRRQAARLRQLHDVDHLRVGHAGARRHRQQRLVGHRSDRHPEAQHADGAAQGHLRPRLGVLHEPDHEVLDPQPDGRVGGGQVRVHPELRAGVPDMLLGAPSTCSRTWCPTRPRARWRWPTATWRASTRSSTGRASPSSSIPTPRSPTSCSTRPRASAATSIDFEAMKFLKFS